MIRKEASIFLIVGMLTVGVDFSSYHLLLWLGVMYSIAKAGGFIAGTIFAYFANKHWTFNHVAHAPNSMLRFASLYAATLGANVMVNQAVLGMVGQMALGVNFAFLMATVVSALLNFLGMKFFVFKAGTSKA
jgi:putative flippase GtrA